MPLTDSRLVQAAEEIVKDVRQKLDAQSGTTQISRAVEAALVAEAPCVFRNWLAYQAKRRESKDVWQVRGKKSVYEWVLSMLDEIERVTGPGEGRDREIMKVLARFLGYLRRTVVAELAEE
ncbi:MAG: hypothetical protein QME87_11585 [Bacillota bacterium]|nr:hypothetical protein [Bacillota bacterium]